MCVVLVKLWDKNLCNFFPGPTSLSYLATKWFLVICGSNLQPFEERVLFVSRISFFSFRQGQHLSEIYNFFCRRYIEFFSSWSMEVQSFYCSISRRESGRFILLFLARSAPPPVITSGWVMSSTWQLGIIQYERCRRKKPSFNLPELLSKTFADMGCPCNSSR